MATDRHLPQDEAVAAVLAAFPEAEPSAGLQARILADFDAVTLRRARPWAWRLSDLIWPGAPVWQPASLLALSLVLGLTVGILLPSPPAATNDGAAVAAADEASPALTMSGDF